MSDGDKAKEKANKTGVVKEQRLTRRDALKRMVKGMALVGTVGVTGIVTQGQDSCMSGYSDFYADYYNYSNAYYNYSDGYSNYANSYDNYSDAYSNYSNAYYNYDNYVDY